MTGDQNGRHRAPDATTRPRHPADNRATRRGAGGTIPGAAAGFVRAAAPAPARTPGRHPSAVGHRAGRPGDGRADAAPTRSGAEPGHHGGHPEGGRHHRRHPHGHGGPGHASRRDRRHPQRGRRDGRHTQGPRPEGVGHPGARHDDRDGCRARGARTGRARSDLPAAAAEAAPR